MKNSYGLVEPWRTLCAWDDGKKRKKEEEEKKRKEKEEKRQTNQYSIKESSPSINSSHLHYTRSVTYMCGGPCRNRERQRVAFSVITNYIYMKGGGLSWFTRLLIKLGRWRGRRVFSFEGIHQGKKKKDTRPGALLAGCCSSCSMVIT